MRTILERPYFERDPVTCARGLLGCGLRWGDRAGIIVETEAYDAKGDPACHTFSRPSSRAFLARHPAGTAYVYLNYGMHWMLNVLVKGRREGFVLLRAIEPVAGIEAMRAARGIDTDTALCSGPGKLAQALGVTGGDHGRDLCGGGEVGFTRRSGRVSVAAGPRIGISLAAELPWRFFLAGNDHVSPGKKKAGRVGPGRL